MACSDKALKKTYVSYMPSRISPILVVIGKKETNKLTFLALFIRQLLVCMRGELSLHNCL